MNKRSSVLRNFLISLICLSAYLPNRSPLLALVSTGATYNNILVNNWNYQFKIVFGGDYRMIPGPSAAIGELRPDYPGLEVATGNEEYHPLGDTTSDGPLGRWFLFSSKGDVIWWKDTENDEAHSSINLADLNGDGTSEIIGGTTSGNEVQAIHPFSQWVWANPYNGHVLSTPATARMGNNEWRVFAGSFDYSVKSFRGATGQIAWRFVTRGPIWSTAAIGDTDGDGAKEVLIGSDDGYLYCLGASTG
ncbi:MAG: PQQ-binding-like beta-propeller repeat protein, partial [Elusimicrobiota bacterium]